jgi:preprotein translocase subunit SecA
MEKKRLENFYMQLQEEAENLKIDIEKFNDSKYLADYAREHYLYSKDGEYIIQIDDIEQIEDDINGEINKNYIIGGLSIFMLVMFIYIISKGKKSKK